MQAHLHDYESAYCGPRELTAELLRSCRESPWVEGIELPFTESALQRLIEKVYGASLLTEEGRYPRLRIIMGSRRPEAFPFDGLARFPNPAPIKDEEDLRRLAPAVTETNCALWITEAEGEMPGGIECLGIVDADSNIKSTRVGVSSSRFGGQTTIGGVTYLMLTVEGPGWLRASFAPLATELQLRGARIRRTSPLFTYQRIVLMAERITVPLYERLTALDLLHHWSRVLGSVASRRHGGAFLLLPEHDGELTPAQIRADYGFDEGGGFETTLDLGMAIARHHASCDRVHRIASGDPVDPPVTGTAERRMRQASGEWLASQRDLGIAIDLVAALSSIDGCVVLDSKLRVHLFGARIRAHSNDKLPLTDGRTGDDPCPKMSRLGQRNNSACQFSREHRGAFAFVVSEDSDLRVYCSDEAGAYAFLEVDARSG